MALSDRNECPLSCRRSGAKRKCCAQGEFFGFWTWCRHFVLIPASNQLVPMLEDRTPRSVGFFLYYPSRRQMPAGLQPLILDLKSHIR